jgi:hypothetical protein
LYGRLAFQKISFGKNRRRESKDRYYQGDLCYVLPCNLLNFSYLTNILPLSDPGETVEQFAACQTIALKIPYHVLKMPLMDTELKITSNNAVLLIGEPRWKI